MAQSRNLDQAGASRLVRQAHPALATLAVACGKTRQAVIFLNEKRSHSGKGEAQIKFREEVQRVMKDEDCDYNRAFNKVSKTSPLFANSDDLKKLQTVAEGAGGVPQFNPALGDVFRLPKDTSPQEWQTAWKGNDETVTPIDYGKIFQALAGDIQVQKGVSIEDAVTVAKDRFPDLWKAVEELAKLAF